MKPSCAIKALFCTMLFTGAMLSPSWAGEFTVVFADPAWDGKKVPDGQHCKKYGGHGATPALRVSGIPEGTAMIVLEFNDLDYGPMSSGGGHGVIGFSHDGGTDASLPPVAGETSDMPQGVTLVRKNRARGAFNAPGYLPPCSGGRRNKYRAVVMALDANGDELAETEITLGRY